MVAIKIIFFALGTFYGVDNTRIAAEIVTVDINLEKQIIQIELDNIFSVIATEQDSLLVASELESIGSPYAQNRLEWREEFDMYDWKTMELISDSENRKLDGRIELKYQKRENLKDFSIDYSEETQEYAIINIPAWNIKTSHGELRGNYWYFKDQISFTMQPGELMNDRIKQNKKSLYYIWEEIKP